MSIIENSNAYTQASFTLKNRLLRLVWNLTYLLLFRFTPRYFHPWRSLILTCFGAEMGKNCHVYPKVKIWAPWNLAIGDQAGIADDVNLYSMDRIEIGKRVVISQGAHICAGSHDFNDPGFQLITNPIFIGDQAWLCADAFIHPGVTIPEGCVIGARAVVVNKKLDAWGVYAGNPCIKVSERKLKRVM